MPEPKLKFSPPIASHMKVLPISETNTTSTTIEKKTDDQIIHQPPISNIHIKTTTTTTTIAFHDQQPHHTIFSHNKNNINHGNSNPSPTQRFLHNNKNVTTTSHIENLSLTNVTFTKQKTVKILSTPLQILVKTRARIFLHQPEQTCNDISRHFYRISTLFQAHPASPIGHQKTVRRFCPQRPATLVIRPNIHQQSHQPPQH